MTRIKRDPKTIAEIARGENFSPQQDLGGQLQAPEPTESVLAKPPQSVDPDLRSNRPTVGGWNTLTVREKDEAAKVARMAIAQLRNETDGPDDFEHKPGQQNLFDD